MKRLLVLAGVIASAGISFAQAQDDPEIDCDNAMVQFEMNFCANKAYEVADKELNTVYRQTMAAMRDTDRQMNDIDANYVGAVDALKKAQRAWIDYRDGQCELAGFEARGGTMEPMLVSGCLEDMTKKRTAELKVLTEGPGN